jgi:TolB-like protein/tetratricopeptide (TPR) repeat protein/predicted Ser/Thr protein kinase
MSSEKNRQPSSSEVSPHGTEVDPQFSACANEGAPRGFPETQAPDRRQGATKRAHVYESSSTSLLAIGHLLGGRYRIERELGEGGMGVVYLAADEQVPGERFAIKVLKEELRPEALALLREEVRKTRKLSHPNIVDVHSVNVDGQRLYLLMEYLEGKSLDVLLAEEFGRGMSFSHAWPIIEDVAAALGNAHDHNVIHSDLKPANVFLTTSGRTKLLDFGIARVSRGPLLHARTGPLVLTPGYASCEMLQGKEADRRDDIYSFACLIYEMLCGERPFGELTALEAREAGTRVPPLQGLSREQNGALAQALAFDREGRTPSVEVLLGALAAEHTPHRRPIAVLGIAIVAALAAVGLTYLILEKLWVPNHSVVVQSVAPTSEQATTHAGTVAFNPPPHSIAVLPLANESGDSSQQYFSDGISEDLITALSQFPGVKVIGRTSSFHFRDSKEDSRSIGAKLGVAHVLEGSVRRSGDVVRVSAQLINTEDGSAQWSERYDRPYKDLFALQDEVTRAVVVALRAKLLADERGAMQTERPPSGSLEAYNAFLQGQFFERRGTEADYRKAIGFYTQATEIDPRYARAWSGLSGAWSGLSATFLDGISAQAAYAKSRTAADRALILSPELAAAHIARGQLLYMAHFDWRGSEGEYRRALELAPRDGRAQYALGVQLATFGQVEQAIKLTREALASDPLRDDWYSNLAIYLSGLHQLDEAERAIRRAIDLQPVAPLYHGTLAIIEIQRGDADAALAVAQQEAPGVWQDVALALARQIGVDRSAADSAVRTLIAKDVSTSAYQIAEVYALRGDANETFAWLERAWTSRDPGIATLLYGPFILRYKDDPRFAAFCQKVGLPTPAEVEKRT